MAAATAAAAAAAAAAASCVTLLALAAALPPTATAATTTITTTTATAVTTTSDSSDLGAPTAVNTADATAEGVNNAAEYSTSETTTTTVIAEPAPAVDNSTCTTDHRLSAFPIRLIKCNIADLTCFREGRYVYGGGEDGIASGNEPRCTGLWSQGPCDKFEWLVVDKVRFYASGYIRTTCAPASLCPKGYVMMGFDGNCYSNKEVAVNCPKVRGFKLTYNVFGEGECVCGKRAEMPVRYCDTVAVGGVRPVTPQVRMHPVPRVRMY